MNIKKLMTLSSLNQSRGYRLSKLFLQHILETRELQANMCMSISKQHIFMRNIICLNSKSTFINLLLPYKFQLLWIWLGSENVNRYILLNWPVGQLQMIYQQSWGPGKAYHNNKFPTSIFQSCRHRIFYCMAYHRAPI